MTCSRDRPEEVLWKRELSLLFFYEGFTMFERNKLSFGHRLRTGFEKLDDLKSLGLDFVAGGQSSHRTLSTQKLEMRMRREE